MRPKKFVGKETSYKRNDQLTDTKPEFGTQPINYS